MNEESENLSLLTALAGQDFIKEGSIFSYYAGRLEKAGLLTTRRIWRGKVEGIGIELTANGRALIRSYWTRRLDMDKDAA